MKDPGRLLVKPNLNQHEIRELSIQTAEPYSTIEATERVVKKTNSTYSKASFDKVPANTVQLHENQ